MFRIGFGYDAHPLVEGRALVIGGCRIPYEYGLLGHSDADVLIHAIMDAILGALARGDIGSHFPDTDQKYKDIKSIILLEKVVKMADEEGFIVNNVDNTIVAEKPRLSPHISAMRNGLAAVLGIGVDQISIKATTTEGLGFPGRREGIEAYSIISLVKKE